MPSFTDLMKQPAQQAPKPKLLPTGDYEGVVKGYEILPAPSGKDYTQILRFKLGLIEWPENASEEDKLQPEVGGTSKPIDLSKREMRKDFYDNSIYRLDDFIKSCGVPNDGSSYEQQLPQLIGARVKITVGMYVGQNNEPGNNVVSVVGQA